jgi:hypothetical protein
MTLGLFIMDTPILVAIISAAASLAVAAITFFLTKRKEREAEWRKQKCSGQVISDTKIGGVTAIFRS